VPEVRRRRLASAVVNRYTVGISDCNETAGHVSTKKFDASGVLLLTVVRGHRGMALRLRMGEVLRAAVLSSLTSLRSWVKHGG
jgi:hypothetical protein